jgi:hypothetical protein
MVKKKETLKTILKSIPRKWQDLFRPRINGRTTEGLNQWKTIRKYVKRDKKKLGLMESLVVNIDGKSLSEILNVEPFDYQTDVEGVQCLCSEDLSREVYVMEIEGRAAKGGKESQMHAKIRNKVPLSKIDRKSHGLFFLGSTCYRRFDKILSDFDIEDTESKKRKQREEKEEELKETDIEISKELQKRLEQLNINPEEFKKLKYYLEDVADLDDVNVLYQLDPGKNRSFGNWFREGIKQGKIENEKIIKVFEKLRKAPKSLTTEDLGALVTYSYEYRRFDTKAVIGGIRDDLFYLDSLKDNDELIKEYGRPNLDKHYVRPATRFRERKGLENVTIREKLGDPSKPNKMSFLEGLGILLHFPKMEEIRIQANRDLANKYGVGRSWDYILKEIKPVFEEVKKELAEEYKKYGEIVKEHVLTDDEYKTCKRFFEKSRMGRKRTERENYLRMHNLEEFRKIAPVIVAVGRKLRYARRLYDRTGDEELKDNALKQEYILKEDFKERFEELTGIKDEADIVIDKLVNSKFVKNGNFRKFQARYGEDLSEMYKNGLIAKRHLIKTGKSKECAIQRQYINLIRIRETNEETNEKLEKMIKWVKLPFVEYKGPKIEAAKYIPGESVRTVGKIYSDFFKLFKKIKLDESNPKRFEENKAILASKGRILYLDEGEHAALVNEIIYDAKNMKEESSPSFLLSSRKLEYHIAVYNVKGIEDAVKKIRAGVKADKRFLTKLNILENYDLKAVGLDKFLNTFHLRQGRYDRVVVSKALKEKVENIYKQTRNLRKP